MQQQTYDAYCRILRAELIPAMGCTEPIAIAYCAALAARALGQVPQQMQVQASGNIVKNVKGVTVPNSGGRKGIAAAAVLGAVAGDAGQALEVLAGVTAPGREKAAQLLKDRSYCRVSLLEGGEALHMIVTATADGHSALAEIRTAHTNVTRLEYDGQPLPLPSQPHIAKPRAGAEGSTADVSFLTQDKSLLTVRDILAFAQQVSLCDVEDVLAAQVECNTRISAEGLGSHWGAGVGKTLLDYNPAGDVRTRARAAAAAGSDARMGGCPLPVVINSGSGNQGLTVSLPVIEYARELNSSREQLLRALIVSNLISIHQKRFIGSLSAYCGATSAACGAVCGIAFLQGLPYEVIAKAITNTIANIGGMVCDGAKPSCAAKIAAALDAGLLGLELARRGESFGAGEGLVKDDVEQTIRAVGRMAYEGMQKTDEKILQLMLED